MYLAGWFCLVWGATPLYAATAPVTAFTPGVRGLGYGAFSPQALGDARPLGRLNFLVFAEGGRARDFNQQAAGLELDFKGHPRVDFLAAAVGHRVYSRDLMPSPLDPRQPQSRDQRFVRLSSGLRLKLPGRLRLEAWAGTGVRGGQTNALEAELSWWPVIYSYYPVGLSCAISRDDTTRIQVKTASAQIGFGRALGLTWFLTGRGQLYSDGPLRKSLRKSEGRASGGVAAGHARGWGFRLAGGGGTHGRFAEIAIFHIFRP